MMLLALALAGVTMAAEITNWGRGFCFEPDGTLLRWWGPPDGTIIGTPTEMAAKPLYKPNAPHAAAGKVITRGQDGTAYTVTDTSGALVSLHYPGLGTHTNDARGVIDSDGTYFALRTTTNPAYWPTLVEHRQIDGTVIPFTVSQPIMFSYSNAMTVDSNYIYVVYDQTYPDSMAVRVFDKVTGSYVEDFPLGPFDTPPYNRFCQSLIPMPDGGLAVLLYDQFTGYTQEYLARYNAAHELQYMAELNPHTIRVASYSWYYLLSFGYTDGKFFIPNQETAAVDIYDAADGSYLSSFNGSAYFFTEFCRALYVTCDAAGYVYVIDWGYSSDHGGFPVIPKAGAVAELDAPLNPVTGEHGCATRGDGGAIVFYRGAGGGSAWTFGPVEVFAEGTGPVLLFEEDGALLVSVLGDDGSIHRRRSRDNGRTWADA
jgi:hypothetical protein